MRRKIHNAKPDAFPHPAPPLLPKVEAMETMFPQTCQPQPSKSEWKSLSKAAKKAHKAFKKRLRTEKLEFREFKSKDKAAKPHLPLEKLTEPTLT
jgi:hypothetical protein